MYDKFSVDYDRFVNWQSRLAAEVPFIEGQLQAVGASRVLDAACGTGMHAVALAQRGYQVVGSDLSAGMIDQARANADAAGVNARFEVAGFGTLSERVGRGFDAVLCLGNSLPHVVTRDGVSTAISDFAACLEPGGLLLIQNRNFDRVMTHHDRWMDPQSYLEGTREWLFLRFYDFEADGSLTFNVVTLRREEATPWDQYIVSTRLRPLEQKELTAQLHIGGLRSTRCWGNLQGAPFDAATSGNLVTTSRA